METEEKEFQFMNIKDPTETVIITVYLRSGYPIELKTTAKQARECIAEWRKFVLYYSKPEFDRRGDQAPLFTYYFFDGDPLSDDKHICAMFLFGDVSGMRYIEIPKPVEVK